MAATASGSWATDEPNGTDTWPPQRSRTDTYSSNDTRSVPYPGYGARRKMSDYDVRSDSEYASTRRTTSRPASRPGNSVAAKKRSKNQLREKPSLTNPSGVDDSAWIHRDKLAQIEIREMEEAGYSVGRSRGARSTEPEDYGPSERSPSRHRNEEADVDEYQYQDEHEQKRMSTIPGAEEEEYATSHANQSVPDHDYDTPDVQAAEQVPVEQQTPPRGHQVRPSTSRIPIVKGSTPSSADRDSNVPRSRSGSIEQSARMRSNSISSPIFTDEEMKEKGGASPQRKPGAKKNTPPSDDAKTSEQSNDRPDSSHANINPGTTMATGSTKQPGPAHQRGPSANPRAAPEGDPPWFNSMFKPDPRLPPDQQMLPTHAKRMMQEQWAKEGKPSTVYDRDFMQLTDEELRNMVPPTVPPKLAMDFSTEPASTSPKLSPTQEAPALFTPTLRTSKDLRRLPRSPSPDKTLPDPPPAPSSPDKTLPDPPPVPHSPDKSDAGSIRPGTSGGYRITPTIPTLPLNLTLSNPLGNQRLSTQQPRPYGVPPSPTHPTPHIPDLDEKDEAEQKKGCCCVMM